MRRAKTDNMDGSNQIGGESRPKAVFVDAASMKEKVKEAIMKPEYNVHNFYHDTGYPAGPRPPKTRGPKFI